MLPENEASCVWWLGSKFVSLSYRLDLQHRDPRLGPSGQWGLCVGAAGRCFIAGGRVFPCFQGSGFQRGVAPEPKLKRGVDSA